MLKHLKAYAPLYFAGTFLLILSSTSAYLELRKIEAIENGCKVQLIKGA